MKIVEELSGSEFVKEMRALGYGFDVTTLRFEGNNGIMFLMAKTIQELQDRVKKLEDQGK